MKVAESPQRSRNKTANGGGGRSEEVSKTEVSKAPQNIRVLHKNGSNIIHQNTLHT